MQSSSIQYKPEPADSNALMYTLLLLPIVLAFWLFTKRHSGLGLGQTLKKHSEMQILSQQVLPRGGLLVKVQIEQNTVYLLESNRNYQQIDLSKSTKKISKKDTNDEENNR